MHVIVALEPRAFREVVAEALRLLRPAIAVYPVHDHRIDDVLETVDVDLVIASGAAVTDGTRLPWLVLGDPTGATFVERGESTRIPSFDFSYLLSIVDAMATGGQRG